MAYVLAGVGTLELIDKASGNILATSNTLTDSGISFAVTAEDIRGGQANKLLAQYFHDSGMSLTLTDALFDLNYLALNVGGTISVGGDIMTSEQIVTTVANQVTVTETPQDFIGLGAIGWVSIAGKNDWTKVSFTGKTASVADLPSGSTVCVKYIARDEAVREFTVSSAFIPDQCYALLTLPLFKSGTDSNAYSSSSKVGEVQVEIPTFLLSGGQDLSLTSSGAATTALSGNALATFAGGQGCNDDGYYAKLKEIIFNRDEFAEVKSIVIADSDIDLAVGETETIQVYAIYGGATAPKLISNDKLTFTSSSANATVGASTGVVEGVSDGEAVISVIVTNKTSLEAKAVVTVTTA